MKCFVTGASGFIGSHLVRELLARGHRVKVLLRPGADERSLLGLKFERVTGDILDRRLLEREMEGCQWCFHLAANGSLWLRNYAPMYEVNVEGTRNVLAAAGRMGCQKIIHTSTTGCIGLPPVVKGKITPAAAELEPVSEHQMVNDYLRSKYQAEAVAMELVRKKGLPIIIVNPSATIGPGDFKPTPVGRIMVDFLNRRLPPFVDAGLNLVHVRDVAVGHILAAEKGQFGQRYILGSRDGNWTMAQMLAALEELTGIPAPRNQIPRWLALRIAEVSEYLAFFSGRPPRTTLAGVRMAQHKLWFDPAKAIRELGLPQTPPRQALAEAIRWFGANGYAKIPADKNS
jgi:dihydroflavonol-4-reductase